METPSSNSIRISSQTLVGFAEEPSKRLNGRVLSNLFLYVALENQGSAEEVIKKSDVSLSCVSGDDTLLYVDQPHELNGADSLSVNPKAKLHVQLFFLIPGPVVPNLRETALVHLDVKQAHWQGVVPFLGEIGDEVT